MLDADFANRLRDAADRARSQAADAIHHGRDAMSVVLYGARTRLQPARIAIAEMEPRVRAHIGFGAGGLGLAAAAAIVFTGAATETVDPVDGSVDVAMIAPADTDSMRQPMDFADIETATTPELVSVLRPFAQRDAVGALRLYVTLLNRGAVDDQLIAAEGPDGLAFDLIDPSGRPVEAIPAPAGAAIVLEQGGAGIRLPRSEAADAIEGVFEVTLMFETAGVVVVEARIIAREGSSGLGVAIGPVQSRDSEQHSGGPTEDHDGN